MSVIMDREIKITEADIEALSVEAARAGDLEQVETCRRALIAGRLGRSWAACERAIATARAARRACEECGLTGCRHESANSREED